MNAGLAYTVKHIQKGPTLFVKKSLEINYNQPQLWERVKTAKARIAASGGGIAEKYPVAENVRGHENVE